MDGQRRTSISAKVFPLAEQDEAAVPLDESIPRETHALDSLLRALCEGQLQTVFVDVEGRPRPDGPRPLLLLPGSFNPLHRGHCDLAEAASRRTGLAAVFELSVVNADKPYLTVEEARSRLAAFAGKSPLWLTRAATFVEKAQLFPGVVFIVGADTAERIVQPRFYGGSAAELHRAMTMIRSRSCRFLVAGRVNREGHFVDLSNLDIPEAYSDLFMDIPADEFRVDLCSSQLREAR